MKSFFSLCLINFMRINSKLNSKTSFIDSKFLNIFQAGLHIIGLLDSHVALACVPVVCTMEIIASVYTYGSKKFNRDVLFMTGEPLARVWLILWRYIIPVILLVSFLSSIPSSKVLNLCCLYNIPRTKNFWLMAFF